MAICNALNGPVEKTCENNSGGIRSMFIGDFSPLKEYTITNGEVTSFQKTLTLDATLIVDLFNDQLGYILITGDVSNQVEVGDFVNYQYSAGPDLYMNAKVTLVDLDNNDTRIYVDTTVPLVWQVVGMNVYLVPRFFNIALNRNTSSFTEEAVIDMFSGTNYYNQSINLILSRRETTKRDYIDKLLSGQKSLIIAIIDSNGNRWMFGLGEGCTVTSLSGGSGVSKGDRNGYEITFTGMEPLQAPGIDIALMDPEYFQV